LTPILNLGIVAHIDAGKTTLTENLLFEAGVIKSVGRVDHADTVTDSLAMEKAKGITIRETTVSFVWNGVKVNLLDTPGHADFYAEVARGLRVLDAATLVVSAREGIQTQTLAIARALRRLHIPTVVFLNKLDRIGADPQRVRAELESRFDIPSPFLQKTVRNKDGALSFLSWREDPVLREDMIALLAQKQPHLLDLYLENPEKALEQASAELARRTRQGALLPVFQGVALRGEGVREWMDGLLCLAPPEPADETDPLSALVYKVTSDDRGLRRAYARLYAGTLRVRDSIPVAGSAEPVLLRNLEKLEGGRILRADAVGAGDIALLPGLPEVNAGDVLGVPHPAMKELPEVRPVLTACLRPFDSAQRGDLIGALSRLTEEDPLLAFEADPQTRELTVRLLGEIQKEFLQDQLRSRFGIATRFFKTMTIFQETPLGPASYGLNFHEGGNHTHAAEWFTIEPLPRGAGIEYVSAIEPGLLPRPFHPAIKEGILRGLARGLWGWEVTDIRVTLTRVEFDSVNSTPADYRRLAPMIIRRALKEAGTRLLEPVASFEIRVPQDACGRAVYDVGEMEGSVTEILPEGENLLLIGKIPLRTSLAYAVQLASFTKGRGEYQVTEIRYVPYAGEAVRRGRQEQEEL